jgi:aspartate kinase
MKVFKFGGASVKNTEGIINVANIIKSFNNEQLLIVISAMGKTTNALEAICNAFFNKTGEAQALSEQLKAQHLEIVAALFDDKNDAIYSEIEDLFAELHWAIEEEQIKSYDYEYDQIVSIGELLSTKIVAAYLNKVGISTLWLDARDIIKTDNTYREGTVDWEETAVNSKHKIQSNFDNGATCILTQGFIGATSENFTTTLGREGSDYSAAILAHCLNATEVNIWKDVPGVLNADPKEFADAVLLNTLSYYDAIELAYYGATVIHPKTLKPLQNKNIPLRVKSFVNPQLPGTVIQQDDFKQDIPTYIFKKDQVLLSISARDFSFIVEENIRDIFQVFANWRVKANLMQHSALNFSVCITVDPLKFADFISELTTKFKVKYNDNCTLITIRNYSDALVNQLTQGKSVLLEQKSRNVIQVVISN